MKKTLFAIVGAVMICLSFTPISDAADEDVGYMVFKVDISVLHKIFRMKTWTARLTGSWRWERTWERSEWRSAPDR